MDVITFKFTINRDSIENNYDYFIAATTIQKTNHNFHRIKKKRIFNPSILKFRFGSFRVNRFTLKVNILKYSAILAATVFIVACSTKRNTFLSRNSHALSTKYNILYNGGLALDAGINELKTTYKDNFWERLPIERMQEQKEALKPGETPNPNFERAENKAIKAIQKHSMNIGGTEKNPQMDEAHLVLGKARYYDQRFVPALEAFNYILYKYPSSDKIYEVKVWREKTNIRMENDAIAAANLRKLLSEIKFKDQIFADANAILAQAYLNLEQKDSAIAKLKVATEFTEQNEEKARYRFILGQLYEEMGQPDSAYASFQEVIDMNRKAPRQYVIHAHAHQSMQFPFGKGDTIAFLKKYNKMLEDRENRPYLDALNYQLGLFYDQQKNYKQAGKYYNASLKHKTQDAYMVASNYRNLADIYFNTAKYATAGKYYDSTLVNLNPRSREHKAIKRKRENLEDVIKYEAIANANDSILSVVAMTAPQKVSYYEDYISRLKKLDEEKKIAAEKAAREAAEMGDDPSREGDDASGEEKAFAKKDGKVSLTREGVPVAKERKNVTASPPPISNPGSAGGQASTFYFYNPTTVAYGKAEFRKIWGDRSYGNNWRTGGSGKSASTDIAGADDPANADDPAKGAKGKGDLASSTDMRYDPNFYISQLPTVQKEIDSIAKERNFAYYQLGVIYKEKFREYKLASNKLEQLLVSNPEERLILPSMYNLYKIYELTNASKAAEMKARIIGQYPDSRYAQILSNVNSESIAGLSPDQAYNELFKRYESGDYIYVLSAAESAIDRFTGDEIVSKFELLKANVIGKLRGLEEYKKALNFVALTYPNSPEGKEAEALLGKDIPKLESLQFTADDLETGWKVLYRAKGLEDKATKALQAKIKKFMDGRKFERITTSYDIYTETDNFVVIHGMTTKDAAEGIASILKDFKDYKVQDKPIIISSRNYQIVQMRKNLDEYLAGPVIAPASKNAGGSEPKDAGLPNSPNSQPSEIPAERQRMRGRASDGNANPVQNQPVQNQQPASQPGRNPQNNAGQPMQNPSSNPGQPGFRNQQPMSPPSPGNQPQPTQNQYPNQPPGQSIPGQNINPNPSQPQPSSQVGGPPPTPQTQSPGK